MNEVLVVSYQVVPGPEKRGRLKGLTRKVDAFVCNVLLCVRGTCAFSFSFLGVFFACFERS
jgi:hypothetical protein